MHIAKTIIFQYTSLLVVMSYLLYAFKLNYFVTGIIVMKTIHVYIKVNIILQRFLKKISNQKTILNLN